MQSADSSPLHPSTNRVVYECLVTFIFLMFLGSLRQVVRRRQSSCGDILATHTTLTIIKDTTKLQVAWEEVLWNAASAAAPGWGKHKVEAGTALLSLASSRCQMGNWTKVKRAKSTTTFILSCGVSILSVANVIFIRHDIPAKVMLHINSSPACFGGFHHPVLSIYHLEFLLLCNNKYVYSYIYIICQFDKAIAKAVELRLLQAAFVVCPDTMHSDKSSLIIRLRWRAWPQSFRCKSLGNVGHQATVDPWGEAWQAQANQSSCTRLDIKEASNEELSNILWQWGTSLHDLWGLLMTNFISDKTRWTTLFKTHKTEAQKFGSSCKSSATKPRSGLLPFPIDGISPSWGHLSVGGCLEVAVFHWQFNVFQLSTSIIRKLP